MLNVNDIMKRIIIVSIVFSIFALFINEKMAYIKGIVAGAILAIVLIKLIEYDINKLIEKKTNRIRAFIRYILRFIIITVFLCISAYDSMEMLIGVTLGILSLKIALYSGVLSKS